MKTPQLCELDRDSPTLSKLARMLILQFAASSGWEIGSFDVRTAFLSGSDDSRLLGLEPPAEMRHKMKLADHEIVQLLKGAYGRVDAPLLWLREFQPCLLELQFTQHPFDRCLFTLQDKQGQTCGMRMVFVVAHLSSWRPSTPVEAERIGISLSLVYTFNNTKIFPSLLIKLNMSKTLSRFTSNLKDFMILNNQ